MRRLAFFLLLCGLPWLAAAQALPEATEREWATAQCVAALDVQTESLAQQVRGGRNELKDTLRARLRAGAAFIGRAWLDGERDEARSQALLNKAREAQRSLPAADLAQRQARCAGEGDRLLAQANPFSRAVLNGLAERRMKKLLGL